VQADKKATVEKKVSLKDFINPISSVRNSTRNGIDQAMKDNFNTLSHSKQNI
jgi:hypothetical protein